MKATFQAPQNTSNALGKKRKKPKNTHKNKKDDENILSKDIDDTEVNYMDTKKILKPREELKSFFSLQNLKFKPQKYKGRFLPYHLRWVFCKTLKSNEFVLLNEIEGLENEINRLKKIKMINRECRKIAGLPFGIITVYCQCCHLIVKKKHDCSHAFCGDNCAKKKADELMNDLLKKQKNQMEEKGDEKAEMKGNKDEYLKVEEKNEFKTCLEEEQNDERENKPRLIFQKVTQPSQKKVIFKVI